jgi:outer membrane protein assembly factor BamB
MLLADDTLFIAGLPDILDEDEAFDTPFDPETKKKIAAQDAAYEGKDGALLIAVSSADGKTLLKHNLTAPPTWDGMAAANGKIYITTKDGKITCLQTGNAIARQRQIEQ